jgi:hypothetical protein
MQEVTGRAIISLDDWMQAPLSSKHAARRSGQRSFNDTEIAYVHAHGRLLRRTGIRFYFLGTRDVPPCDRKIGWIARLIGTTLLVSPDDTMLITLYKNQHAIRDIKRKAKYRVTHA